MYVPLSLGLKIDELKARDTPMVFIGRAKDFRSGVRIVVETLVPRTSPLIVARTVWPSLIEVCELDLVKETDLVGLPVSATAT